MRLPMMSSAGPMLLLFLAFSPLAGGQTPAPPSAATPTSAAWPAAKEVGPAPGMAHARPGVSLVLQEGSSLSVKGATTQHPFELWAGSLLGSAILKAPLVGTGAPNALLEEVKRQGVLAMTLDVPIARLQASDSEVESGSDYALAGPVPTLHGQENPYVEFSLRQVKLGKEVGPGVYALQARGELSIAGVTQEIPLQAIAAFSGEQVRVTGYYKIHLAVFKVRILQDVWGSMGPNPMVDVDYDVTFSTAQ
jgi:hypothetical protein